MLPVGFVYLDDPRMVFSMDYVSSYNFLGRPVAGYHKAVCIMTAPAAQALMQVQDALDALNKGYRLKIFDTYRPTQAVDDFIHWSKDISDEKTKADFYPELTKSELFALGYLADKSSHSRGSTVDLTLVCNDPLDLSFQELEMGTAFDFFGEQSHTANPGISEEAKQNRKFLCDIMSSQGFENYPLEWWHFTLRNEPFPDTYFNFPVQ